MTRQLREVKPNIIKELRALVPRRALTYSESYILAERQANMALALTGQTEPDVNLGWILDLPRVELQLAPRHKMDGIAGFTTFTRGHYFIMVNKNDTHARRRFTLAHEFKHLVDYTTAPVIHKGLGYGNPFPAGKPNRKHLQPLCCLSAYAPHLAQASLEPWRSRLLLRSLPNPLTPAELARIRDARPAGPPPQPAPEPVRVDRRVSCRGAIVVAGQRIHVGMVHAGRTVTVESADHTLRVYHGDELLAEVARTTTKPIARFKVRKPEAPRRAAR